MTDVLRDVDAVGDIPLERAPLEETRTDSDGIISRECPDSVNGVVFRHFLQVVFEEIVDRLAEKVQGGFSEDALVVLGVHHELHKQCEEEVELLELPPIDPPANSLAEFEESVSETDITPGVICLCASAETDTQLCEGFDFVEVGLVEDFSRHSG